MARARRRRLARASLVAVPRQRDAPAGRGPDSARRGSPRRRPPDEPADDPRARLRPRARPARKEPGADVGGPSRSDSHPAPALRRRPQREAVDPARHRRRHPRPRPRQDQRRLRDRRPRAHDPDDQGLPRASRSTTSSRSTSRTSPSSSTRWAAINYTGGCVVSNINGGAKNGGYTLRLQARHEPHRRQAGARARPHAQERVQPARERPHPRPAPAEDPRGDEVPRVLPRRRSSGCRGSRGTARSRRIRHGRPAAARLFARRARVDGNAADAGAQAERLRDAARRRRRPDVSDAEKQAEVAALPALAAR